MDEQLPILEGEEVPQEGTEAQPNPLITLAMTEDQATEWWQEIEQSEQRIKDRETEWDTLMEAYIPKVTKAGEPETINSNFHFRNTHTKLANLFYRSPELQLEPLAPLMDPIGLHPVTGLPLTAEDSVPIKKAVLDMKLGRKGVNASWLIDRVAQDALQWAGLGCLKVGYSVTTKAVQVPDMIPAPPDPMSGMPPVDPTTGQPAMVQRMTFDPTTMQQVPATRTEIVPIHEDWYMKRFSPKKLLLPADLNSPCIDEEARFVGHKTFMSVEQVNAAFGVNYEAEAQSDDDRIFKDPKDTSTPIRKKVAVYELFVRASTYRPDEQPHPLALDHIVFVEGIRDRPVVHRPSPDQTFDELGKLTPDSIEKFPIRVLYLRDMPDSPFPPSDAAFVNSQVKHLNTHLQQSVRLRDAAVAKMAYDEGALTEEEVKKIKSGKVGDWIALQEGALANGIDKVVAEITKPTAARDDYRLSAALKSNMDETLGIDANTSGIVSEQRVTATEIAESAKNSGQRMGKEQLRLIDFYLSCVEIYDVLLQRYATADDYIQLVGMNGEKRLALWNNKVIAGKYAYDIKPDSQLHIDAARDRQQTIMVYEKTAADPMVNRYPVLRKLFGLFGLDPGLTVNDPALMAMQAQGPEGEGDTKEPGGSEAGRREHRPTGGRPNAPEAGQKPNTERPN